jgi:hypothetical protein
MDFSATDVEFGRDARKEGGLHITEPLLKGLKSKEHGSGLAGMLAHHF